MEVGSTWRCVVVVVRRLVSPIKDPRTPKLSPDLTGKVVRNQRNQECGVSSGASSAVKRTFRHCSRPAINQAAPNRAITPAGDAAIDIPRRKHHRRSETAGVASSPMPNGARHADRTNSTPQPVTDGCESMRLTSWRRWSFCVISSALSFVPPEIQHCLPDSVVPPRNWTSSSMKLRRRESPSCAQASKVNT